MMSTTNDPLLVVCADDTATPTAMLTPHSNGRRTVFRCPWAKLHYGTRYNMCRFITDVGGDDKDGPRCWTHVFDDEEYTIDPVTGRPMMQGSNLCDMYQFDPDAPKCTVSVSWPNNNDTRRIHIREFYIDCNNRHGRFWNLIQLLQTAFDPAQFGGRYPSSTSLRDILIDCNDVGKQVWLRPVKLGSLNDHMDGICWIAERLIYNTCNKFRNEPSCLPRSLCVRKMQCHPEYCKLSKCSKEIKYTLFGKNMYCHVFICVPPQYRTRACCEFINELFLVNFALCTLPQTTANKNTKAKTRLKKMFDKWKRSCSESSPVHAPLPLSHEEGNDYESIVSENDGTGRASRSVPSPGGNMDDLNIASYL